MSHPIGEMFGAIFSPQMFKGLGTLLLLAAIGVLACLAGLVWLVVLAWRHVQIV